MNYKKTDGIFATTCPHCGVTRFLKSNPGKNRDCLCPSCQRKGKPSPFRYSLSDKDIKQYLSGISANQLSKDLNITPHTFIKALKRAGITPRTMSEAISLTECASIATASTKKLRRTGEMSIRLSAGHQKIDVSQWQGFAKTKWDRIKSTKNWAEWRKAVYERDQYACILCGKVGNGKVRLSPHHIKRKVDFPDLMFDVDNGVTLCHACHCIVNQREKEYEKLFTNHVQSLSR